MAFGLARLSSMQFSLPLSPPSDALTDESSSPFQPLFWNSLELEAIEWEGPFPWGEASGQASEVFGLERGFRVRRRGTMLCSTLVRAWTPHEDVWRVLRELDSLAELSHFWKEAQVRRMWFCAPLRARIPFCVWRAFARSSSSRQVHWRRSQRELWLRLVLPPEEHNTLQDLPLKAREVASYMADAARQAFEQGERRTLRDDRAPAPLWLRAASNDDFARVWRDLALELELWQTVALRSLVAPPRLPDYELRDWEKVAPQEGEAVVSPQRRAA